MLQEYAGLEHKQAVKRFVHQSAEVAMVEREENVSPSQGAEENRPILSGGKYYGQRKREYVVHYQQTRPQPRPIRACGRRGIREVPNHLFNCTRGRD